MWDVTSYETLYVSYLRYVLVHCRRSVSPKITMSVYKINILENLYRRKCTVSIDKHVTYNCVADV